MSNPRNNEDRNKEDIDLNQLHEKLKKEEEEEEKPREGKNEKVPEAPSSSTGAGPARAAFLNEIWISHRAGGDPTQKSLRKAAAAGGQTLREQMAEEQAKEEAEKKKNDEPGSSKNMGDRKP